MRADRFIALALMVPFCSCVHEHDPEVMENASSETPAVFDPWAAGVDIFAIDIVQRTCALEVVLRVRALEDLAAFGVLDDSMERWAMPPEGNVLACTGPPASTDPSRAGSPGLH